MVILSRVARAKQCLPRAFAAIPPRPRSVAVALVLVAGIAAAGAAALTGGRFAEADGWKARITVDCLLKDKVCGSFRYETQACEGDLIYSREIANGFEFRTELRAGRCLPGCLLQLSSDFKRYTEICTNSRHEGSLVAVSPMVGAVGVAPATAAAPTAATAAARTAAATKGLNGQVRFRWDNGDVFDGQMVDGKRNGKGRMVWASGQTYDGDWRDDVAVGEGAMTFPNGDRYQGQVKDGIVHGRGRMQFANGDTFEGQFEQGIPDVEGSYTEKDGSRYVGQWKKGLKHGRGKSVWASGQSFDGDWVADKPEGRGVIVFANGDRYDGGVSGGQPQGKGIKVYASQDRYEGDFQQGEAHGEGFYRWKNGDTYNGRWQKGKKVGAGRYRWASGDYWEGEFADDKRTEAGRLYFTTAVAGSSGEGAKLASQADALAGAANPGEKGLDRGKLLAIPMVAKELRECSRKHGKDCATRVVDDVLSDNLQEHKWQTMASDKGAKGKASVFEVDTNSVLEGGNVFTWLRSGDGTQARNIGIKYDCRAQAIEIQLIYHCSGGGACALDPNIDKYAGKVLPATDIKGWFKEACER
jgi:hypothetical protein